LNSRKGVKTSPAVCYTICRIIFAITEIPFLITENKVILLLMPGGGGYRFAALLSFQQPNFWGHLPKSLCRDVALVTSGGPGSAPRVPDRIPIWLILQCRRLAENHATPELLMVYLDLHSLSSMYTKYNLPDNLHYPPPVHPYCCWLVCSWTSSQVFLLFSLCDYPRLRPAGRTVWPSDYVCSSSSSRVWTHGPAKTGFRGGGG
jgi:hypothetical protein